MKSANINCWKLKNSKCTYDKEALYSCKAFPKRNAMGVVRVSLTSALLKGLFEIDILYSYVGSYSLLQSWCLTSVHVYSEVLLSNQESAPPPVTPTSPGLLYPWLILEALLEWTAT